MTDVALRTMLGFLRGRARRDGVSDGRSGAVAIVQRFGGALNLNVHLHALVLDGVFVLDEGIVQFHPARRLRREDVTIVVALIARRLERLLERRGRAVAPRAAGAAAALSEEPLPSRCVSVGRADAANVRARCPGVSALRLRVVVALIEQASVVQRILGHLGLPTEVPEPRPARPPPRRRETLEDESRDGPEFDAAW